MDHLDVANYAREAAEAAFDAHGNDQIPADVALEFLINFAHEVEDDEVVSLDVWKLERMAESSVARRYFDAVYTRAIANALGKHRRMGIAVRGTL